MACSLECPPASSLEIEMKMTLIRHGESKKNICDVIGGKGEQLTARGKLASRRIGKMVAAKVRHSEHIAIYFAPTNQTAETSHLLSREIKRRHSLVRSQLLKPIHLGPLSGITSAEAWLRFPTQMEQLKNWNDGLIDISKINLEGMQDINEFFETGNLLIKEWKTKRITHVIVVGTRSSLVLLHNIFNKRHPGPEGSYMNIKFRYTAPKTYDLNLMRL